MNINEGALDEIFCQIAKSHTEPKILELIQIFRDNIRTHVNSNGEVDVKGLMRIFGKFFVENNLQGEVPVNFDEIIDDALARQSHSMAVVWDSDLKITYKDK